MLHPENSTPTILLRACVTHSQFCHTTWTRRLEDITTLQTPIVLAYLYFNFHI